MSFLTRLGFKRGLLGRLYAGPIDDDPVTLRPLVRTTSTIPPSDEHGGLAADLLMDMRGLNDTRDLYFEQSRNTKGGVVAPFPSTAI